MRILITTDAFTPVVNGVVTSTLNLYKQLKEHGHDVKILTLAHGGPSHVEGDVYYISSIGINIYPNARVTMKFRDHYIHEIVEWKPDVIHSQTEFCTFLFARKIARKLDIPVVHTYHTLYQDYTAYFTKHETIGQKLVIGFSKTLLNHVDGVIVPTEKTKRILEGYGIKEDIQVIPNGIELDAFKKQITDEEKKALKQSLDIDPSHRIIVTVGRLGVEKNVDELLEGMRLYLDKRQDITLVIVGDGPYKEALEQHTRELGIENHVVFTGMIEARRVYQYYQLGEIFVSASNSETQGLTYIEALANGLPIVCKKDECLFGVLEDDYNGYMFETPQEMVERVEQLLENSELYNKVKENTMSSVERFSSELFGDRVEDIYMRVVHQVEQEAEHRHTSLIG
ncbi:MAG: glycosyltransferase family 4 protein [Cellulosilyticum sp.]|nr:glycosyltransferase family 4 protein [Cellulosilyticum sp.]